MTDPEATLLDPDFAPFTIGELVAADVLLGVPEDEARAMWAEAREDLERAFDTGTDPDAIHSGAGGGCAPRSRGPPAGTGSPADSTACCAGVADDARRTGPWRPAAAAAIIPSGPSRERPMTAARPEIDCEQYHVTLHVRNVLASVEFYTARLGFRLDFTWGEPTTMAGVSLDRVQIFLQQGTPAPAGCSLHFVVGDADELHDFHRASGVEIVQPPGDREYHIRDYGIRDPDGYYLEFGHRIALVEGPPLPIERVDVPVRLEKRLAALLHDLAVHKRMSLSGTLEEILLHTSEPLGDGVASPHTKRTLRHIQELKRKHGVDYDSHASYRFVEPDDTPNP